MYKKIIIFATLILFLVGGIVYSTNSTNPVQTVHLPAKYIGKSNVEDLENSSDLIIIGTPTMNFFQNSPTVKYTSQGRIENFHTATEIKVLQFLKNNHTETHIRVIEPAALAKPTLSSKKPVLMISGEYSVMAKGKKYLLFLKRTESGEFSVISGYHGKYGLDGSDPGEQQAAKEMAHFSKLRHEVLKKYGGL